MSFRPGSDGVYSRGNHARAASSVSGWSILPPLSIKDTLVLHLRFLRQGLSDASKVEAVIETLATNKAIQANTLKSTICQGVILFSALIIQPLLGRIIPSDYSSNQSRGGMMYILFHTLWLYPLALASIVYAGLLKTPDLTPDRRGHTGSRNDYRGLTAALIGESYKGLMLANYFLFVFILRRIPLLGGPIAFLYACIVDAYYCYETQWLKLGWQFEERVKHLESRWAYFIGFGLPITFLSWWSSDPVVNLAIFSLFFPLFRIMSTSSIAQPIDPKLPTSSMSVSFLPQAAGGGSFSMAAAEGGEEARGRQGHPWVPIRIRALVLADKAYKVLLGNFVTTVRKKDAGPGATYHHHHHQAPHLHQQPYGLSHAGGPAVYDQSGMGPQAGWRNDVVGGAGGGVPIGMSQQQQAYGNATPMPPPPMVPLPHLAGPREPVANGFGYGQLGATTTTTTTGVASGTAAGPSAFVQTPPRRGHVQTESAIGVGAEFVDRNLDSLIQQRKKGD